MRLYQTHSRSRRMAALLGGVGMTVVIFSIVPLSQLVGQGAPSESIDQLPMAVPMVIPDDFQPSVPDPVDTPPEDPVEKVMDLVEGLPELPIGEGFHLPETWWKQEVNVSADTDMLTDFLESDPPRLAKPAALHYPKGLARARVEGHVVCLVTIDVDGSPIDVEVRSTSDRRFNDAAIAFLKASRYAPARRNGKPVRSRAEQTITFKLPR